MVSDVLQCITAVRIGLTHRCSAGDQCADVNARCTANSLSQCTRRLHNVAGVCGTLDTL